MLSTMVQVLHPELSEPQLAGSQFQGKQLNVFVLWHLLVARHDWVDAGLQEPSP